MKLSERAKRVVKRAILPRRPALRRLPAGIGRDLQLHVNFDSHLRLFLGLYESELNKHFRGLCRTGYKSFDVGSGLGYNALVLARLTRGTVISFECDETARLQALSNVAANLDLANAVDVRAAKVGAETSEPETVALDNVAFAGDGFVPDVINIDVEGAELEVLRGAARILRDRRPHVIVETHSRQLERDCFRYLAELEYEPEVVRQRRILRDHRPLDHNRWLVARGVDRS